MSVFVYHSHILLMAYYFLETINYDDMRDILDGGYITLGNDDFLTLSKKQES